jgi:TonB family protein
LSDSYSNDSNRSNGTKLACINEVILKYPPFSVRMKQEGVVSLRLWFSSDGFVVRQELLKTSGFKLLDEAAMKAYSGCQIKINK